MFEGAAASGAWRGDQPLVSVVTIFLNGERYLREAVESIFAQTYGSWELLLVDDGSNDRSTEIAREYADLHPERVRVLEHPGHLNCGMSASRNLGLRHARGAFLAFLDADDVWLPRKLELQVDLLLKWPAVEMVYGPSRLWHSWTGRPEDLHRDDWRPLGVPADTVIEPPRMLVGYLKDRIPSPATCSVLIRREAAERVGGFEDRFSGMYEDQAFFVKIFLTSRVFASGECVDRYRQHSQSCCAQATEAGEYHPELPNQAHLSFLKWLKQYLAHAAPVEADVLRLLRRKLWLYRHPVLHRMLVRLQLLPVRMKGHVVENGAALAFLVGRWVLPVSVRQRLWTRWVQHHVNGSKPF